MRQSIAAGGGGKQTFRLYSYRVPADAVAAIARTDMTEGPLLLLCLDALLSFWPESIDRAVGSTAAGSGWLGLGADPRARPADTCMHEHRIVTFIVQR